MANFTPSNLVKGQALFNQKFQSGEWRFPDTAVLASMFIGEKANPSLAGLRRREDRAVSAYFPIRRALGSATERLYNHTGARGDSSEVVLSWDSIAETFSISLKQNDSNMLSFEENWAAQLRSAIFNVLQRTDSAKLAQLIADKTQINKGIIQGAFNQEDDVMEVDASASDLFFQNVGQSMRNNLYNNNIMVIADSLATINAKFGSAQGQGNGVNLGFQFNGMNIASTTKLIDSDYAGAALAFDMDLAGMIPWIPKQNRKALDPKLAMSFNGDFGKVSVPVLDDKGIPSYTLDFALHSYAQRADTSASNGVKQDVEIEVEVSLDTAYVSAPLSDLRATDDTGSGGLNWTGKTDSTIFQFGQKPA
jgi:hypothetical protein